MQLQQVENKLKDEAKSIANLKSSDYENMVSIDELQQYQKRDCLEIIGIPSLPNDKPKELVKELGSILGVAINDNDISTAHRLPSAKKIQDRIIVKFVRRDKREEIYKARKLLLGKLTDCLPSVNAEIGKSVSQPTKSHSNALNKLKTKARNNYYNQQFLQCKNNLKTTWKLIGTLINRKSKGHVYPTRIKRNDKMFTNPSDIAEQFNQHFLNVGPNLANLIPSTNDDPTKYITNSPTSSFFMSPVTEEYVCQLFSELNVNKSSLDNSNDKTSQSCSINTICIYF